MAALGYSRDIPGYRWKKRVEDQWGRERELVWSWPTPTNVMLRYLYNFPIAGTPEAFAKFGRSMSGRAHPLWRMSLGVMTNKNRSLEPITNPLDYDPSDPIGSKARVAGDYLRYMLEEMIPPVTWAIGRPSGNTEAEKLIVDDIGRTWGSMTEPFSTAYMRGTKSDRLRYQLYRFIKEGKSLVRKSMLKKEDPAILHKKIENFRGQMIILLNEIRAEETRDRKAQKLNKEKKLSLRDRAVKEMQR